MEGPAEPQGDETVLWEAVRQIVGAMQSYLIPGGQFTEEEFLTTTVDVVRRPDVLEALGNEEGAASTAIRTIAEAAEAYLAQSIDRDKMIGTSIAAVDNPAIAIALYGPAQDRRR